MSITVAPKGCSCLTTMKCKIHPDGWSPENFQGRTPEQQSRNERACEIIAYAIMALIVLGAVGWLVVGWV